MASTRKETTGGFDTVWEPVKTIRAEVIGLDGRESVMEKVLQGISVYRITIRWRSDVSAQNQLLYGQQTLNIRSAVDPDDRREQLVIIADTESTLS
jgi:SPP1 family predicted phage head-tail adaptor